MKKIFLFIVLISIKLSLIAADAPQYPFSQIPKTLLENANAVVRLCKHHCQIIDEEQYHIKIEEAITILNEQGDRQGVFYEMKDRFREIEHLQGAIYDVNGKLVRKFKKTEFTERLLSSDDGTSDSYQVSASPAYSAYPYTVVYTYSLKNKNPLWYPSFMPQQYLGTSVQSAQFSVVGLKDNVFRYKMRNTTIEPKITQNGEEQTFVWTLDNLPAIVEEPWDNGNDYFPSILTAPNRIRFEGYEGNFKTWKDFGLFFYQLNDNRLDLPVATVDTIKKLVANASTTAEKARLVYHYMQDKTRYISIQLGIGGWQCFAADKVDKNGYGDCKALSNYTKALLQAAGVESNMVLISAKEDPTMLPDFVSNQFNHAILCIPNRTDTIWLECTSQMQPFNFMDGFTNNRYALLIKSTGGELVRTPTPIASHHVTATTSVVQLPTEGMTLSIESEMTFEGEPANDLVQIYQFADKKEQEKWVQRQINPTDSRLESFAIEPPKDRNQLKGSVKARCTLSRGLTRAGKRLLVAPNTFSSLIQVPEMVTNRKTSILIAKARSYIDTVRVAIPTGYTVEKLPESANIETVFGKYQTTYAIKEGYLQCIYALAINVTQQPPSAYSSFCQFLVDVRKANNKSISLIQQ